MVNPDLSALASPDWKKRRQAIVELARRDNQELAQGLLDLIRFHHQDPNALNASLALLRELKTPVTGGLISLLQDEDAEVRMYAVLALGDLPGEASIPALLGMLKDPNPNVRFNAIEALGKLRAHEAVDPLITILHVADFFLFFAAVQALVAIGDPRPVPDLLPLISVERVAPTVVQALGRLGDMDVIDPILGWLESESGEVAPALIALVDLDQRLSIRAEVISRLSQRSVQKILASIPSTLPPHPSTSEIQIYSAMAVVLGWIYMEVPTSPEEARRIIAGLVRLLEIPSDTVLQPAFQALQEAGEQAALELSLALNRGSSAQRQACAQLLSNLEDPVSIPRLLEALDAEDEVAADVVRGLGKITRAHPEYQKTLINTLVSRLETDSPSLRQALVDSLSGFEASLLSGQIEPLTRSPNPDLRLASLKILVQSGNRSAPSAVIAALEDESQQVQRAAVEALAGWPAEEALPFLARFLQDEKAPLRVAAVKALGGSPSGQKFPLEQALPLLHAALQDADPWTRLAACHAVGRYGQVESLKYLARLTEDSSPAIRLALAGTLGQIGGSEAVALLDVLMEDGEAEVQQAAREARFIAAGHLEADDF